MRGTKRWEQPPFTDLKLQHEQSGKCTNLFGRPTCWCSGPALMHSRSFAGVQFQSVPAEQFVLFLASWEAASCAGFSSVSYIFHPANRCSRRRKNRHGCTSCSGGTRRKPCLRERWDARFGAFYWTRHTVALFCPLHSKVIFILIKHKLEKEERKWCICSLSCVLNVIISSCIVKETFFIWIKCLYAEKLHGSSSTRILIS